MMYVYRMVQVNKWKCVRARVTLGCRVEQGNRETGQILLKNVKVSLDAGFSQARCGRRRSHYPAVHRSPASVSKHTITAPTQPAYAVMHILNAQHEEVENFGAGEAHRARSGGLPENQG